MNSAPAIPARPLMIENDTPEWGGRIPGDDTILSMAAHAHMQTILEMDRFARCERAWNEAR